MTAAELIVQVIVLVSGSLSVWMTQSPSRALRRWACVVGIVGQPAWLAFTWSAGQWGMFAVSLVVTAAWLRGLCGLVRRAVGDQAGTIRSSTNSPPTLGEKGSRQ